MPTVLDRFLEYTRVDTRSVQHVPGVEPIRPSSPGQTLLIGMVTAELLEMGVPEDRIQKLADGSILVHFPPTSEGLANAPHACFAAHVDTYFGCPGLAKPMIHDYKGGDIALPNDGIVIPAIDLAGFEGKRVITADGTSLLGADDKAGAAALVTLAESLLANRPEHGPVTMWFCVDEEIGEVGVNYLPAGVADQWDIFWTVDGKELSTVDVGCFYGARVIVKFIGNDAHPGVAGDALRPAHYAAGEFLARLANGPNPWTTGGEEPFIYVPELFKATAGKTDVIVYPRTFNPNDFPALHTRIKEAATAASIRFGVRVEVGETEILYVSTEAAINAKSHLVEPGLVALRECGFDVRTHRIRAGTDGAMINMKYPDMPAPNLGTGSGNLHGCREFLVEDHLWLVPDLLRDMVFRYAAMVS